MAQTLINGDIVLIDKKSKYGISLFDICVIYNPTFNGDQKNKFFVKRFCAYGKDEICIRGKEIIINNVVYQCDKKMLYEYVVNLSPNQFELVYNIIKEKLVRLDISMRKVIVSLSQQELESMELKIRNMIEVQGSQKIFELNNSHIHQECFTRSESGTHDGDSLMFFLGDNRNGSTDSRIFGYLPRRNVVGKVILLLFRKGVGFHISRI